MRAVNGLTGAAPIWHDFMSGVLEGKPELDFASEDKPDYTWKDGWERAHRARPKATPAKNEPTTSPAPKGKTRKPPKVPVTPPSKPTTRSP
jgi:membrane peptidoglycan carboxypeptidase